MVAWITITVYYLIIALTVLIYLSELKSNNLVLPDRFMPLIIFPAGMTLEQANWINLTYYFGITLCMGLYLRAFYRMIWVDHYIHIYAYLRDKIEVLNESLISGLPVIPLDDELTGAMCSLCLDEYTGELDITKLPCDHVFHRTCIKIWITRSNACPLCRRKAIF